MEKNLECKIALIIGGLVFLAALTGGTLLTSFMCRLSRRLGAVDKPDGDLKCHNQATPTLGGIPLFLAMVLGILSLSVLVWVYGFSWAVIGWLDWNLFTGGMFVGGLIILLLGASDDLHHVMPHTKLLFQIISAMVLIGSGLVINHCDFFGVFGLSLGAMSVPFTLFWLIGSCNAFNFIDGMDGLASGIGIVTALVLSLLGFMTGHYGPAIISLALAGSLMGVLFFNLRPALIFLGDSGSQLIGLILGALTIKIASVDGVFALPTAGLILSVPVLDALLSILRRYSMGKSPIRGDRKHIHHCLRRYGLSVNQVSMTLWAVVLVTGGMGIVFWFADGVQAGLAALTFVALQLYVGSRLGCLEGRRLAQRLVGGSYRWKDAKQQASKSQPVAKLEVLWERMEPLFEKMQLDRAVLTLEGVSADGRTKYETYQWVRSDGLMAELLGSQWTKRFALEGDEPRVATLRLESAEHLWRDEDRIDWLLQQIRNNMRQASRLGNEQMAEVEMKI